MAASELVRRVRRVLRAVGTSQEWVGDMGKPTRDPDTRDPNKTFLLSYKPTDNCSATTRKRRTVSTTLLCTLLRHRASGEPRASAVLVHRTPFKKLDA